MHQKRNKTPKEWPIQRKGTKYVVLSNHNMKKGIPLVVVLRDILKFSQTRREARKICLEGKIKINGKIRKNEKFPVCLRDVLHIDEIKKSYICILKNNKFYFQEIPFQKEIKKTLKVIGKKILPGKKIQANLEDGTNVLTNEKFSSGDSFLLSFPDKKVLKIIPLKIGSNVEIIKGKYRGLRGKIKREEKISDEKLFLIKLEEGREVLLSKKSLLAIE